jgi:hypothetical protein
MKRNRFNGGVHSSTVKIKETSYKGYTFNFHGREYFAYREKQSNLPNKSMNSLWCVIELGTGTMLVKGESSRAKAIQKIVHNQNTK